MATACKISFKLNYTSSVPIQKATAFYKLKDVSLYTKYDIPQPIPVSGVTLVELPVIQASGQYDLMVELGVDGVTARQTNSFQIGKCNPISCKAPDIHQVYLGMNDQIIMDYSVDAENFYAVQYQIATDIDFKYIVQLRVIMGSDYTPTEYIEMNDGTIPDGTQLYIRARKHCSVSDVSDWSKVVPFRSGKWRKTLRAYCVSGAYEIPTDIPQFKASICGTKDLMKTISLNGAAPGPGSLIYLSDGVTRAVPGNLSSFDIPGGASPSIRFNESGIAWIRFEEFDPTVIYRVDQETGRIGDKSERFTCAL